MTTTTVDLDLLAEALEQVASWVRRTTPAAEWNLVALSTLDSLGRHGPQRVSDLVAWEAISQPGMTGIIARLAGAGLVSRGADPADGRATRVSITEAGRRYLRDRHGVRAETVASHLRGLPVEDRRALLAATGALTRLAATPTGAIPTGEEGPR